MPSLDYKTWFEQFSTTGNISPIRLGMTRSQVRSIFGEPHDVSVDRVPDEPSVWKYGDLEFHFDWGADGTLCLIYMDTPEAVIISIPRLALTRSSPVALLQSMQGGPHVDPAAFDELEKSIEDGSLPVRDDRKGEPELPA
ncbi:MAG TPA: hypothetical protein VH370_17215 [Humisphaera sp.]|jgi:hypothetical protein|nr:hypothetical protein [Humisphaera sp.]